MFWENFYNQCLKRNTKPNPVAKEVGISSGVLTKWKNGAIPNGETLIKLSAHLDCSIDYLLGIGKVFETRLSSCEELLLENFNKLNEEGQEKLISYSDDLLTTGKYIKSYQSSVVQKA